MNFMSVSCVHIVDRSLPLWWATFWKDTWNYWSRVTTLGGVFAFCANLCVDENRLPLWRIVSCYLFYCLTNHRQTDRKFEFLFFFLSKIFRKSACLWSQLCTQGCLRAEDGATQGLKPLQLSVVRCSRTCATVIVTGACLCECVWIVRQFSRSKLWHSETKSG